MQYQLSCSCGRAIPVAPGQAGGTVTCPACGASLAIPTLGQLRQLPPLDTARRSAASSSWAGGRGLAFALLTAAALACFLAAAFGGYRSYSLGPAETLEEILAHGRHEIDTMDAIMLLTTWMQYEHAGLGPKTLPYFERHQQEKRRWQRVTWASLAGGIGFTAIASGVVIASRRSQRG